MLVVLPNSPPLPLVVVAAGAPKAGLFAPNGELLALAFVLLAPNPPKAPPDVAVLPPKSEPPADVVFVFAPKPVPPVLEEPKPPKVELLFPLPKPKDMFAAFECEKMKGGRALALLGKGGVPYARRRLFTRFVEHSSACCCLDVPVELRCGDVAY